ncbi:hypothetical protein NUW58_g4782 [Xylaria curta]|uniref:Uncharacterized protein n=1 Tax=Xylaria curta TaxID=42375 RepID=A0ACC1P6J9_9PEZI|nr:hypothetical protein NUW58_g4782 [Xylaria curta]
MAASTEHQEPWYLRSGVPVLFPAHDGFDLSMPQSEFDALVQDIVRSGPSAQQHDVEDNPLANPITDKTREMLVVIARHELAKKPESRTEESAATEPERPDGDSHPFIQGLLSHDEPRFALQRDLDNRMLTENGDIAYRSTTSPIVDLFTELEDVVSGPQLQILLKAAWEEDSLASLKIIVNARSIHLGKASQIAFYRCAGRPAKHCPLTLIANLRWLSRPVIQKKAEIKEKADTDMVIIDAKPERDADDVTKFDVKHGVSHGYWKDLLNILVLKVRGKLDALTEPRDIFYDERQESPGRGTMSQREAKAQRHRKRDERNNKAVALFNEDPIYRGLYLAVARLFAEQLKSDLALLNSKDLNAKKDISLCAKWAPSHDRFHDKSTFIVSSIAEMLHPIAEVAAGHDSMDRELYLRHAREHYRGDISALRAHLDIVERNIAAKTYEQIKYDRVPSVAMSNYAKIFAQKDTERFEKYLDNVANGKMSISGATLLPSTLVNSVRANLHSPMYSNHHRNTKAVINAKMQALAARVAEGQWKTLVQRIKDSGTLQSSIAVCDVSGSMEYPIFPDSTCPMDSAIGLSLLLAEVTVPPFGGHFITFSEKPRVKSVDLSGSLHDKVSKLAQSKWGMNTNFVAVFKYLILPMAIRNKLSQADMVKRVFIFSDMQFDAAERSKGKFTSSFETIKRKYAEAGYEMPELIFWNLAGGRAGYDLGIDGDPTAPKPVLSEETGIAIVSGYSQGMLKVFLDNGTFDNPDDEDEEMGVITTEEDDTAIMDSEATAKKRKIDPMSTVKKAISHKSYDPLVVVD